VNLPEQLFVREQRDPDLENDCQAFTTRPVPHGEADCETDGHYRCWECSRKDPSIQFDGVFGLVRIECE
jgi:hypothetical protein